MSSKPEPRPSQEPTGDASEAGSDSIRTELSGCVFRHVKGFYAKYFEDKSWSTAAEQAAQKVQLDVASALYRDFLELKSQGSFSAWLARLQSMSLAEGQILHHFRSPQVNTSDHPLRAIVYLVASSGRSESSSPPPAADARVFGDFSVDASDIGPESVSRFYETARQVFQARPTRRFLHGFQIRGSTMELWMFDRSGAYSSDKLDIVQRPDLLIKTMASYAMTNDEEAGFTSFIRRDGLGSYVAFGGADENETERLYLEDKPIAAPQYLVGPGTTCYAARTSTSQTAGFVVKFAWREDAIHTERELLELTKDRNVWGVIRALGWQDLGSIGGLRQGLRFNQPYDFPPAAADGRATSEGDTPIATVAGSDKDYDPLFINHAKGVLIDLDGALDLEKGPARRGELVGSEGFMAIGILTGDPHTYRHDLESLFYVFLWVAICNDREHDDERSLRHEPETSRRWGWCSMDFRSVSRNKSVDMSPEGFPRILGEFSTEFKHLKGLARELRQLLFLMRDGDIFTGSDMDQDGINRLYDGMIDAFNRSIASQTQE
ncbi:hypothetical protein QBC46DRAFT_361833 [Diplogelasinospora grovesii]|uniref:Fungal-type protein kinase domain-containing protein n=1 Tax=Diplogelasinospora grovesii TaxID=303347 RepID=A0AAN6S8D3_9PEZI|nr:hypothetical protein QBC46DRAFT_361833 [Diplogelasinospora grovesii]